MNIPLPLLDSQLRTRKLEANTEVWDLIRKKWVVLTPEEHVRQLLIHHLTSQHGYPAGRFAIEKRVMVGSRPRRFDAVLYDEQHHPWMLIECKAPEVPISTDTLYQLLSYHQQLQCQYWLLSNGHSTYCAKANNPESISWLAELPAYNL